MGNKKKYHVALFTEDYFDSIYSFESKEAAEFFSAGAYTGAGLYGGDGFAAMSRESIESGLGDDGSAKDELKKALDAMDAADDRTN